MPPSDALPKESLEELLGYRFRDAGLLEEALSHPSSGRGAASRKSGKARRDYERLEFLGDAALGLLAAEMLMDRYPDDSEGDLAKRHAGLVRGESIVAVARELNLGAYLRLSRGEDMIGGRGNAGNLENATEALIGALYRDGGLDAARNFVTRFWRERMERMETPPRDAKTGLQELSQRLTGSVPFYTPVRTTGPDHSPRFVVRVSVEGYGSAEGEADTKKKAEKIAAETLLRELEANDG
jgi:ribonuclease-3